MRPETPEKLAERRRELGRSIKFTQTLMNLALRTNRRRGPVEPAQPKKSSPGPGVGEEKRLY